MRATVTPLDNNRIKLVVELDDEEMGAAIDAAAVSLAQQVNVKGFRKGKVPKNVLIAHLGGPEVLRSEAIRESLPDFYARAVADTMSDPIDQPEITVTAGEEVGALAFEAEVAVRPEVSIQGYHDLRVTIPSPQVNDAELEAQIDRFRETDAVLNEVDRPILGGDLVTMDLRVTEIGTDAEPLEMSDYMYTVGSGALVEGVDELIIGLRTGEDLTLNSTLESGTVATYELTLKQVKERELPELTDDWVQENTDWSSEDEMRDAILDQLRRRKIVEAQMSQRDAVLVALSDLVSEDDMPEVLVASETNERLHDLGHRLGEQKLNLEMFLQVTSQSPEQLLERLRADATRSVRVDLAMRGLVRAEHLEPDESEIDEELARTAESMGVEPELLRTNLRESGRVVAFHSEVGKMKASRWLNENVTFVDPDGLEIDPALMSADQSEAAESGEDGSQDLGE